MVFGSGSGPLDMKTTVASYSSPEFMLHCKGMAKLGQHLYHLPTWGFAGCSDSKMADLQAGVDSSLWILWTALSGANLVHDAGYVESGMTWVLVKVPGTRVLMLRLISRPHPPRR